MDVAVYSVPGVEYIEITKYSIDLVAQVERDTDIGILYDKWRYLGSPPHQSSFHPRSANAACFRVANPLPMDYEYTSTDDPSQVLPISKLGSELMQKQAMDDLMLVKETREPFYQQVIHKTGPGELCFRRILLPVVNDDGQVDLIYSATRLLGRVAPEFFELEHA